MHEHRNLKFTCSSVHKSAVCQKTTKLNDNKKSMISQHAVWSICALKTFDLLLFKYTNCIDTLVSCLLLNNHIFFFFSTVLFFFYSKIFCRSTIKLLVTYLFLTGKTPRDVTLACCITEMKILYIVWKNIVSRKFKLNKTKKIYKSWYCLVWLIEKSN